MSETTRVRVFQIFIFCTFRCSQPSFPKYFIQTTETKMTTIPGQNASPSASNTQLFQDVTPLPPYSGTNKEVPRRHCSLLSTNQIQLSTLQNY